MKLNTERLVNEIRKQKLTQKDFAEMIGITPVSLSRYIKGNRQPRKSNLMEMARVLEVSPEYLTGFDVDHMSSDETYRNVIWNIRSNCKNWTTAQKRELIILLSVYL